MFDSRGFELNIGDEVLVVQHKNQTQLGDFVVVARTTRPFNTVSVGTVIGFGLQMDEVTSCKVKVGSVTLSLSPQSGDRIFQLPRQGE